MNIKSISSLRLVISATTTLFSITTMADSFNCYTYGNTTNCQNNNSQSSLIPLYQGLINSMPKGDEFMKGAAAAQEQRLRQLQIQEMEMRLQQQQSSSSAPSRNLPYRPSGTRLPETIADCDREYPSTSGNFRSQVRCYKSIDERSGTLTAEAESLYSDWMSMALRADNGQVVPKSELDAFNVRVSAYAAKKAGNNNANLQDPAKDQKFETAKTKCSSLGFKQGTVKHGDCVMKLLN